MPHTPFLFTSSFMFVRECGADVDRCSVLFPSFLFYIAMAYGRGVRVCQCHITVTRNITGNIQHRASIFQYVLNIVFSLLSIFPIGTKCHHVLLSPFTFTVGHQAATCPKAGTPTWYLTDVLCTHQH
ncbi:hypothetical protein PILCRDRAFT_326198 [Piloderma croceum F 1598]|uniref:Uncharacterized protein n=1 Tax=Piloderma croceum (strain F 1598) TaxID=765440 RepID=A0A0C3G3F7_PILCF|nr:hypothetical protein PILCRDRAFT_326198 [Piloderma croceum F 1598]